MRRFRLINAARPTEPAGDAGVAERTRDLIAPEVQALLDHARVISPLPRDVRARALARARAVLEAAAGAGKAHRLTRTPAAPRLPGEGADVGPGEAASSEVGAKSRGPRRDERGPRELIQKRVRRG